MISTWGQSRGFNFASLWAGGKKGMWYQPLDANTRYQDQAGTMPATIVNPATGLLLDKSGNALPLRQATDTARPLFDARVNLLTKTEQFDDAVWDKVNSTATTSQITYTATGALKRVVQQALPATVTGISYTKSIKLKYDSQRFMQLPFAATAFGGGLRANFDLLNGVVGTLSAGVTASIVLDASDGYYQCTATATATGAAADYFWLWAIDTSAEFFNATSTSGGIVLAKNADARFTTSSSLSYQRVNTDTDYDIAGFPQSLKYNGIDAGMGTNSFVAGTLTSNMDYFIAFKRNSSSKFLSAASGVSPDGRVFGIAEVGTGSSATYQSGTPTYFVNGVSVAGGTATTRDQLNSAIPVNQWVILEVRNLDLSTWVALQLSQYASYLLAASQGSVVCCEAQSDAVRTQIRQALAAEVGVVLP